MPDNLPANLNDQDQHEPYYEDSRAMVLSHYVMAERCLQVESYKIYNDFKEGDYSTLTYTLNISFKLTYINIYITQTTSKYSLGYRRKMGK